MSTKVFGARVVSSLILLVTLVDCGGGSAPPPPPDTATAGSGGRKRPIGGTGGTGAVESDAAVAPPVLDADPTGDVPKPGTGGATGAGGTPGTDGAVDTAPPPPPANAVTMDPPGANFVGMQMVKLSAGAPDAVIRYTIDGSVPSATSPTYSAPIALKETTILRAFSDSPTAGKGPVEAAIFVRAAEDVASFESNLPLVLLHTHRAGRLNPELDDNGNGAPHVAGSVSIFEPGTAGRTKIVGTAALTARAGVRIRGNSSREFLQKSYAFEIRQEGDDTDDDRPVLGLPSESDWALIAPSRVDRSLVRNALASLLSNEIGRYAPRVRNVEVFAVETGATGVVAKASYQGVYTLMEKIKTSKNRVRVSNVDVNATTEPAVTGGYVFRIDHGVNHFTTTPFCHCTFDMMPALPFQIVEPDFRLIPTAAERVFSGYLKGYMQEFFDALRASDFKHPTKGKHYSEYIDSPSFIDHNLLTALFKNVDGLRLSAYFHKEKNSPVVAGPIWDFDRSSGTRFDDDYGRRTEEPREWARGDGTNPLRYAFWGRLMADPAFKAAYVKRWQELSATTFSVAHIHGLIDKLAGELKEAQSRHFTKWSSYAPAGGSHDAELKILKDWFAARVTWMNEQLK